jgi:hypothetical protein
MRAGALPLNSSLRPPGIRLQGGFRVVPDRGIKPTSSADGPVEQRKR